MGTESLENGSVPGCLPCLNAFGGVCVSHTPEIETVAYTITTRTEKECTDFILKEAIYLAELPWYAWKKKRKAIKELQYWNMMRLIAIDNNSLEK